jgi:hypothetical protein
MERSMKSKTAVTAALGAVAVLALFANFGPAVMRGIDRPLESDAYYYYQLAHSLARGDGYVVRDGFWPKDPSMRRLPGWPFVASLAMRALPAADPAAAMRGMDLLLNAACAVLVASLAWVWFRCALTAFLAGAAFALYPTAIVCADEGLSEPLFLVLILAGTLALVLGAQTPPSARRIAGMLTGFLLFGGACLVRANFLTWGPCFALALLPFAWREWKSVTVTRRGAASRLALLAVGALLFLAPPMLWAARNYRLCRHFPVLSALRGQTFYGGNNEITAEDFHYWGYWVFPNSIPGETPMVQLARTMSEYEVDAYYYARGKAYLRDHPERIPWMLLGKFVRAYIPIPWHIGLGSLVLAATRLLLYGFGVAGAIAAVKRLPGIDRAVLAAMVLTNLILVLAFYGYTRFAFALEPFLFPFAALVAERIVRGKKSHGLSG